MLSFFFDRGRGEGQCRTVKSEGSVDSVGSLWGKGGFGGVGGGGGAEGFVIEGGGKARAGLRRE